ncbi:MAG TPA: PARP-type zinc finger-containing protein [Terriglobia bacterium]|nr:PARP-type zinc finger-containing protein [Terriglobia bacterium]
MGHTLEIAPTGRSKCRGCSKAIERGAVRFGERIPNPFAEGETTLWFHPVCGAFKRPEPFLEALEITPDAAIDRTSLEAVAREGIAHRRLPRIDGAEPAPSGQAKCRHCRETIERGSWRIRLVFFEDGMFSGGGFIHPRCRQEYFETGDILQRVLHFSPDLNPGQKEELSALLTPDGPS